MYIRASISCFTGKCELKQFDKWEWGIFIYLKKQVPPDPHIYFVVKSKWEYSAQEFGEFFTLYCPEFTHFHLNHPVCLFDPPEQWASTSGLADFQREASFSFTAGRKQFQHTQIVKWGWESGRTGTRSVSSLCIYKEDMWQITDKNRLSGPFKELVLM